MKKISLVAMALCVSASVISMANAGNMGAGCGNCAQQGGALSDPARKFQADTIDLRQEMMNKRFEMQRENLKASPDNAKVAALQADIRALQAKIMDIRSKSGLPVDKQDGECGLMRGDCGGMGGKGMGGCNGPCPKPCNK